MLHNNDNKNNSSNSTLLLRLLPASAGLVQGQSGLLREEYSEHQPAAGMQAGFGSVTKEHVCIGADGMPDDLPELGGAAAVPKRADAVPKGAAAVPSPLPSAAAPPASPDISEILGGPHVKLMPPVLPHS